ncbi:flavocytochrome c, partial [bacterium]|nr:flavocytochrome c [bacterium]
MKKRTRGLVVLAVLIAAMLTISCQQVKETVKAEAPAPTAISAMKPGVYKQTVKGMHEGLVVEVTLSEKK